MVKVALFVRLEAKPGKEADVENFLRGGLAVVQEEPATTLWFALRMGPSTFGIFDAFPDEAGRQAHLAGRVAAALMAKASELLAQPPVSRRWTSLRLNFMGRFFPIPFLLITPARERYDEWNYFVAGVIAVHLKKNGKVSFSPISPEEPRGNIP